MSCINMTFIENLLIWCVVVAMVVALLKLLLPRVLGSLGEIGGVVLAALNIIVWAIVIIFIIVVMFDLLSCVTGFPHLR